MGLPTSARKFIFKTPEATHAWANEFSASLKVGDVLALIGPLGAGKTTLVQGLAAGWKARTPVTSPTFSLVNEYASPRGPMYHMDMYRLSSKEARLFPLEDYLDTGLCVIEWADRVSERLPRGTRVLTLSAPSTTTRALKLGHL
jgi:tRNA threonylcarbamoyladenosine biosynthesis protein TsaE